MILAIDQELVVELLRLREENAALHNKLRRIQAIIKLENEDDDGTRTVAYNFPKIDTSNKLHTPQHSPIHRPRPLVHYREKYGASPGTLWRRRLFPMISVTSQLTDEASMSERGMSAESDDSDTDNSANHCVK